MHSVTGEFFGGMAQKIYARSQPTSGLPCHLHSEDMAMTDMSCAFWEADRIELFKQSSQNAGW